MPNANTRISELLLQHDIDLLRVEASLRTQIRSTMRGLSDEIVRRLQRNDPTAPARQLYRDQRYRNLVAEVNGQIDSVYRGMINDTTNDMIELSRAEVNAIGSTINNVLQVELATLSLDSKWLKGLVNGTMIQGAPSKDWWARQSSDLKFRFQTTMRDGILNGESIQQLVQRVRGTRAAGFRDGIMSTATRNAEALVRTSGQAVAQNARYETYKANSDVIKGMQWQATLDGRTTPICQGLDGQAWDLINADPIPPSEMEFQGPPPAHWNCRSTLLPVMKSWDELSTTKNPRVRKALKDFKPSKAYRASMDGQVSADMKYADWLAQRNATNPDYVRRILGPSKYRLWSRGKLSFTDMVDQSHRPLTIKELQAKVDAKIRAAVKNTKFKSPTQWYQKFANTKITGDEILNGLSKAQKAELTAVRDKLARTPTTDSLYFKNGVWDAQRVKDEHERIIAKFLNDESIAAATPKAGQKPTYVMFGGRGGSGKGALSRAKSAGGLGVIDKSKFIVLDADAIKAMLPEYKGWNAFSVHAESSYLFDEISARAEQMGLNIVHDMTMKTPAGAFKRAEGFIKAGYRLEGYYMFLPPQTATERAISRFFSPTNRYVPAEVIMANTQNEAAFEKLIPKFDKWAMYDNQGSGPVKLGGS